MIHFEDEAWQTQIQNLTNELRKLKEELNGK